MTKINSTEEFIQKAREVHGSKYDYSLTEYKDTRTAVKIICPEHGEFYQLPYNHLYLGCGCRKCAYKSRAKSDIDERKEAFFEKISSLGLDSKYDFSEFSYVSFSTKGKVICHHTDSDGHEHGEFFATPSDLYHGRGCPKCFADTLKMRRRPYFEYQEKVDNKYGKGTYTVDKESYLCDPLKIKVHCNVHNHDFFIYKSPDKFIRSRTNSCPLCMEDLKMDRTFSTPQPVMDSSIMDRIKSGEEVWVPARGYEDCYVVSSLGRIGRKGDDGDISIRKQQENNGRMFVEIRHKTLSVHRLSFSSFYKIDIPEGYTIDHIDSDPKNNHILNLRLCDGIKDNVRNNYNTYRKQDTNITHVKRIFDTDCLDGEMWVPVYGYEGLYSISNKGRIISEERDMMKTNGIPYKKKRSLMRPCISHGRERIGFTDLNGKSKTHFLHRVMYESFYGKIDDGCVIDHIDSNPLNNCLENLRMCTQKENMNNENTKNKIKKSLNKNLNQMILF